MSCWTTTLTANGASLGKVPLERGIFQGNSLSLLLFIMCLDPLSKILEDTQKGYHWCLSSVLINHLVYMDDVKLYSHSKCEIESLI